MTRILPCADPWHRDRPIADAVTSASRGRVVIVPDESMYTLIGDAFSEPAVRFIRQIKGRSEAPLSVLVGFPGTVDGIAAAIPGYARDLMAAFWPGPLTLLLRQQPSLAWPLRAPGIAVRMPLHPVALAVVREIGPTAATSANRAGSPVPEALADVVDQLDGLPDVALDAGEILSTTRSTVVDATGDAPVVVRAGSTSGERLAQVCPTLVPAGK